LTRQRGEKRVWRVLRRRPAVVLSLLLLVVLCVGAGSVLAGAPGGTANEPIKRIGLQCEKVRYFERFAELRERNSRASGC